MDMHFGAADETVILVSNDGCGRVIERASGLERAKFRHRDEGMVRP
jgi:hypothetical protein